MNTWFKDGMITQRQDADSLCFCFVQPNLLSQMELKVLQNQSDGFPVPCVSYRFNGHECLIYNTRNLQPIITVLPLLNGESFLSISASILDSVFSLQNVGFLQPDNAILKAETIFINPETNQAMLVYLPCTRTNSFSQANFEISLKNLFLQFLNHYPNLKTPDLAQFFMVLQNPLSSLQQLRASAKATLTDDTASLAQHQTGKDMANDETPAAPVHQNFAKQAPKEGIFNNIFGRKNSAEQAKFAPELSGGNTEVLDDIFVPTLVLLGVKTPVKLSLLIDKTEYVIGKNSEEADGCINFSNAISRTHCKIIRKDGKNYIEDIGSANGTFLNEKKLQANVLAEVKSGDQIKLANMNFVMQNV